MMENISSFQLGIDLDIKPSKAQSEVDAASVSEYQAADSSDHFVSRDGMTFAGTHLILDLWGCTGLDDEELIERAFRKCVQDCGATLLHIHLHRFLPSGGISGVAVLAESHISVHTWPEKGFAAFDVFMCGDAEPRKALDVFKRAFNPGRVVVGEHKRGVV